MHDPARTEAAMRWSKQRLVKTPELLASSRLGLGDIEMAHILSIPGSIDECEDSICLKNSP